MKILIAVIPLLAGFLLDCLLGDPYSLPHPIRLIGRFISSLEKWVRCRFSSRLVLGGVVMSIIVLLTSALIPLGFLVLCYKLNVWLGVVLESVLCYYMLAARCLRNESMKVYKAIVENDTEKARKAVSMIVGRDTKPLDRNGIIRAAVETVAENTSDGVTAPMLFMGLGGAPLGFFYKAANTMDSMIGYTSEKYLHIGRFAAKLDDVPAFLPLFCGATSQPSPRLRPHLRTRKNHQGRIPATGAVRAAPSLTQHSICRFLRSFNYLHTSLPDSN